MLLCARHGNFYQTASLHCSSVLTYILSVPNFSSRNFAKNEVNSDAGGAPSPFFANWLLIAFGGKLLSIISLIAASCSGENLQFLEAISNRGNPTTSTAFDFRRLCWYVEFRQSKSGKNEIKWIYDPRFQRFEITFLIRLGVNVSERRNFRDGVPHL